MQMFYLMCKQKPGPPKNGKKLNENWLCVYKISKQWLAQTFVSFAKQLSFRYL